MRVELLHEWERVKIVDSLEEANALEDLMLKNNLHVKLLDAVTGEMPYPETKDRIEVYVRKIHSEIAKDLLSGEISHVITKQIPKVYFGGPKRLDNLPRIRKRYGGFGRFVFPLMIFIALLSILRILYEFAFL